MAVADELIDRFLGDLNRLRLDQGVLGLAVSGGADSMAMLLLAAEALDPEGLAVATVDHGLRPEAAQECALVANACRKLGIPCEVLEAEVAPGNTQEQARIARYAALGDWAQRRGIATIATAHHADDQAETVLMRLNRGSGLGGLAGIRSRTRIEGCEADIVRPLLGFRRDELRAIVEASDFDFVHDPSNLDERYDRVRMRKALAQAEWLDAAALARSAKHLEEAERTLQSLADMSWERSADVSGSQIRVPYTNLLDTNARLVRRAMLTLGATISLGEVIDFLKTGRDRANIAGVLVERRDESYFCSKEPPRRGN
ncbi:tRNA lysidine(34) synthetase TilS [Qipengyuania seohaensis]|uniref:tRNA lysidine(34) synthetase TilS n=1 Tax=Qipengyuania seohaensis TaxID=266951 RepID=UPI000C22BA6F|nr:tRNA lysidine(34) synthetase TilS [Qipengyuania seohaensis]